jgi:hypothetical protein
LKAPALQGSEAATKRPKKRLNAEPRRKAKNKSQSTAGRR